MYSDVFPRSGGCSDRDYNKQLTSYLSDNMGAREADTDKKQCNDSEPFSGLKQSSYKHQQSIRLNL